MSMLKINRLVPSPAAAPAEEGRGDIDSRWPSLKAIPRESMALLMQYFEVCKDFGFDSHQAAVFQSQHRDPVFRRLARGLDRLILEANNNGDLGSERSDDLGI